MTEVTQGIERNRTEAAATAAPFTPADGFLNIIFTVQIDGQPVEIRMPQGCAIRVGGKGNSQLQNKILRSLVAKGNGAEVKVKAVVYVATDEPADDSLFEL